MIIDVKGPAGEIAVSTARKRHKVTVTAEAASKRSLAVDLARPTAIAGTSDYDALENRPQINGVLLTGDVSLDALGVPDSTSDLANDSGFITAEDILPVPTKTSELENDSGFITSADIPAVPTKTSELDNDSGFISSPNVVYCTCATGGGTAAKVATIVSGTLTELHAGDQAIVKFTNSNTSASPTLKIGNTDAKPIMRYGTTIPSASAETSWNAGSPILFVYDGTNWVMCGWLNATYSEISAANITNGTSSTTGLISGRRAKSAVEAFAPVTSVNGQTGAVNLTNLVQDLGAIDGDAYDWDLETFLNTLQKTGSYIFLWDEFKYFVDVKAVEVDGTTTVQQMFWWTEEGPSVTAYRNIVVESGEIVQQRTITYLTFQEANSAFSRNTHVHYRTDAKATSVWDYCNTVALQNANPIVIYFDSSTNKTYLIETYVGNRQPVYKMQKVTEMNDMSYFCQRSSYYYSGAEHWGNWYKFTGEVYTPGR